MSALPASRTYAFIGAFLEELTRAGVRHACICPGSRSTPLTMALARQQAIKPWVHLDERSAAFFALGMARSLAEPVLLVCTSGTAAANFFPAVAEANLSEVPLIVATADRPPELQDVGSPQTMDQVRLYGSHAKWAVEVATPEATAEMLRYARTLAVRAVAESRGPRAGVVHLNFPFREPLVPLEEPDLQLTASQRQQPGWSPRANGQPFATRDNGVVAPSAHTVAALADAMKYEERGLIVVGPQANRDLAESLAALARITGFPILADPLSNVRCGPHDIDHVVASYDALLRDDEFTRRMEPEIVLRFGAVPTSKPLQQYLERNRHCRQIVVSGSGRWLDPMQSAGQVVHADPVLLCEDLLRVLGETIPSMATQTWAGIWLDADVVATEALSRWQQGLDEMFEGKVFPELVSLAPAPSTIFAGNSMPVRDLDSFTPKSKRRLRFLANRGVNGIDGVVSSAMGVAATEQCRVVLVIGDLSFYHDLNGLFAAKRHGLDITIVLINNDGGGIFSFLPQAAYPDVFEEYWGTPHGLDFRPVVEMYGGSYQRADTWPDFRCHLAASFAGSGLDVIEVHTERQRNVQLHRQAWQVVASALAEKRKDRRT